MFKRVGNLPEAHRKWWSQDLKLTSIHSSGFFLSNLGSTPSVLSLSLRPPVLTLQLPSAFIPTTFRWDTYWIFIWALLQDHFGHLPLHTLHHLHAELAPNCIFFPPPCVGSCCTLSLACPLSSLAAMLPFIFQDSAQVSLLQEVFPDSLVWGPSLVFP